MPSTDIDGSPIVILGEKDAKVLYDIACELEDWLSKEEIIIVNKLAKTFGWDQLD